MMNDATNSNSSETATVQVPGETCGMISRRTAAAEATVRAVAKKVVPAPARLGRVAIYSPEEVAKIEQELTRRGRLPVTRQT